MSALLAATVVLLTNLLWYLHVRTMQKNALELSKLLASRSLSEYSLAKQRESGEKPPKDPGYESVFDEET